MAKPQIITGLDIGTYSIKALAVVKKPDSEELEVLGKAELPSFGLRRGIIIKVDEVAKRVTDVLSRLQEDIGRKIEDVYINIGGSHIFSTPSHGTVIVSRADQKISQEDVNRVIQAAQAFSLPSNREILDVFPREFIVDGQGQIREPIDMQGLRLEVDVLALCTFSPYLKNLTTAVLNAGFQISDVVPSALASSRAVLSLRQKELGVCLLDIGAGTTDMAVYEEGDLVHVAVFPIGSERITHDLAIGLQTDVEIAERIKQEFGSCLLRGGNKKEKIEVPQESGNPEFLIFSHKMLVKIIEARVSEIFNLADKELKKISLKGLLPAGVVLTGGGARLPKIVELAKKELKLPARIGLPQRFEGLDKDPSFSTVCGLVSTGFEIIEDRWVPQTLGKNTMARFKKVFKIFIP